MTTITTPDPLLTPVSTTTFVDVELALTQPIDVLLLIEEQDRTDA